MRFEQDLLARIDERCRLKGRARSDWVMAALEFVIDQVEAPTVVDRATLRMRIEPIAGNQSGPWAKEIAERETGREGRKQDYTLKKELGMIGRPNKDEEPILIEEVLADPVTGEISDPDEKAF